MHKRGDRMQAVKQVLKPDWRKMLLFAIFAFIAVGGHIQAWAFSDVPPKPPLYDLLRPLPIWSIWMYLLLPLVLLSLPLRTLQTRQNHALYQPRDAGRAGPHRPPLRVVALCQHAETMVFLVGIGIVQMPCPEQRVWGGVLKRRLLLGFGVRDTWLYKLRSTLMARFVWNTKRVFGKIARQIAREIKDYLDSGFEVVGIVGVDGSPSCGFGLRRCLMIT